MLVLEDDQVLRSLVVEALEDEGYAVTPAQSYRDLVARARAGEADVVIADFWGRSHRELEPDEREQVRALTSLAPTVLLTGRPWAMPHVAADVGAAAVIGKPFDLFLLIERLRTIADGASAR